MRPDDFDHVIRATAEVTGEDELVVIGSQAVVGVVPDPPATLLGSMEVDVYPRADPKKADLIGAFLGDGSQSHASSGTAPTGSGPKPLGARRLAGARRSRSGSSDEGIRPPSGGAVHGAPRSRAVNVRRR
jgi:hypothetical protein